MAEKEKKERKKEKKDKKEKKKRERAESSAVVDPEGSRWALQEEKTAERNETFVWAAKREVSGPLGRTCSRR
jgi:ribosomal protein S25